MVKKILIIDNMPDLLVVELSKLGFTCDYKPNISEEEIVSNIHNYYGLVIRTKMKLTPSFIDKAIHLKFIARAGSGMENIDKKYAESKGIFCVNAPEGNRESVGEHAAGMLLSLFHKINTANQEVKKGIWDRNKNIGTELNGNVIAILGYGNTGEAFARKLQGFDVEILAFDKVIKVYPHQFARQVGLNEIFDRANILSIHLPLSEETFLWIDEKFLMNFKHNIYLINTARGKIVKTSGLVKLLKTGKISGACLDVMEEEDKSFESIVNDNNQPDLKYLLEAPNVILTPHVAGITNQALLKIALVLVKKIKLLNLID